jgi:hypothetical protein
MAIKVSLCASANRIKWWPRFYNSLKGNKIEYEVIFVGNIYPDFELPKNFKFIYTNVKPAQAYQIAFNEAQGELIHWTADDADYIENEHNLDNAYDLFQSRGHYRNIISMRTIEDGTDIFENHRFFYRDESTPHMAPLGLMSNKFLKELEGYDKNYISGQSENDIVMRGYSAGGDVILAYDPFVHMRHREVHPLKKDNKFREFYKQDRETLEKQWILKGKVMFDRQVPFEPFEEKDILTVTQGPKGIW